MTCLTILRAQHFQPHTAPTVDSHRLVQRTRTIIPKCFVYLESPGRARINTEYAQQGDGSALREVVHDGKKQVAADADAPSSRHQSINAEAPDSR